VSDLQVTNKSYVVPDHIKNILRSLPARFRPNVTTIQEAKDLNKLSLENLISSLKSHEIELGGDEPVKKSKSIALTSKGKSAKVVQSAESEEETPGGESDNDSDLEKMAYLTQEVPLLDQEKEVSR
jgi:hypothetical protein